MLPDLSVPNGHFRENALEPCHASRLNFDATVTPLNGYSVSFLMAQKFVLN
jgi:hypothetical protein